MSDKERILAWLKTGKPITTWDGITHFRCTRVPARIYDLRAMGYQIEKTMMESVGDDGEVTRYASYRLRKDE